MAFIYKNLSDGADIQSIPTTVGALFTNPTGKTSYLRLIQIHNTASYNNNVFLYRVPNSGGVLGTAALANRIIKKAMEANETLILEYAPPGLMMSALNDSLQGLQEAEEDLFTDGDCSSDLFVKGDGWTHDAVNDEYDCDGSQAAVSNLYQAVGIVNGEEYLLKFTVKNYSAGNVCGVAGDTTGANVNANGDYEQTITAGATDMAGVQADTNFIGSIDDFEIVSTAPITISIEGGQE